MKTKRQRTIVPIDSPVGRGGKNRRKPKNPLKGLWDIIQKENLNFTINYV
ncbi:hypothetical protein [Tenacibaculum phage Larrie]|nr:hypothetical protein [Tenacibaculum phage Larrie]